MSAHVIGASTATQILTPNKWREKTPSKKLDPNSDEYRLREKRSLEQRQHLVPWASGLAAAV
jgi:hypothetical protein